MRIDSRSRRRTARVVLAAAAALLACLSDGAAARDRCDFGAFVQEDDPAGLNVRATPSAGGRVVGTLPPSFATPDNPGFPIRIEVDVQGQQDGWFQVAHARDNESLTGRPARPVPAGGGWVSGRKLTVKSQATQGRAAPDAGARVVLSLADGSALDGDAIVAATHLVGCRGRWAEIELDTARLPEDVRAQLDVADGAAGSTPGRPRAWVDRVCGVQETSCEGGADAH